MKVAYFDCQFGAAGDMLCAALVANGLDVERWQQELRKIALPDGSFEVAIEDVMRCLIASKKVTVKCMQHDRDPEKHNHAHHGEHDDQHDHAHHGDHDHAHEHHHESGHEHVHHAHDNDHDDAYHHHAHEHAHHDGETSHGRSVKEIIALIDASSITPVAKQLSHSIFKNLALSEGRVHGVDPDEVHFHEVGAVDAIIDVVGFAIGYDLLGIEKSVVSPLTLGGGTIRTEHGIYPVPGPAVAYLVEHAGAPTTALDIRFECLTPTGAAILTTIADRWGAPPSFQKIDSVGYGAGTLNPTSHPNVVRTYIGQCREIRHTSTDSIGMFGSIPAPSSVGLGEIGNQFRVEIIAVIEANIDDCPPNIIAYALEKALSEGALDISVVPATMKKGRSGHLITVLAKPQDRRTLETLILKETSTLGVRSYLVERLIAEREFAEVKLSEAWSIRVKIGRDLSGSIVNVQPEYADCATYAERHGLPLREVFEQALCQYMANNPE